MLSKVGESCDDRFRGGGKEGGREGGKEKVINYVYIESSAASAVDYLAFVRLSEVWVSRRDDVLR